MKTDFVNIIPVLPSLDIERDVAWYKEKTGFEVYYSDKMYAILYRENLTVHLQWHADTKDDPLLGGSVIRIFVKNIKPLFEEFVNEVQLPKTLLSLIRLGELTTLGSTT